ncbi:MAG: SDR family oxidoreductase [Actinomyces sp.]|nr:MAG: SDR family oxidoreductase [Actinomyces sp.]
MTAPGAHPFAGTDLDLTGRAALVTGASSGIGAAIARRLAAAGATVALVARRIGRLEAVAAAITGAGGRALVVPADLTDPDTLDGLVDTVVARTGRLDALVAAAGIAPHLPLATLDRPAFDAVVALDLWAPLRLLQRARPHLARTRGAAVTIGSVDADRPSAGAAVYGAAKAGLGAAVVAVAKEWTDDGIRVNQIDPGLIRTEMAAATIAAVEAAGVPVGLVDGPGDPDHVAALAHLLVSDAGAFATATRFRLDGGALATGPFDVGVGATRTAPTSLHPDEPS